MAITTAVKLYREKLGISIEQSEAIRSSGIKMLIEQLSLTPEMQSNIDWSHIESCSRAVVDFFTHG